MHLTILKENMFFFVKNQQENSINTMDKGDLTRIRIRHPRKNWVQPSTKNSDPDQDPTYNFDIMNLVWKSESDLKERTGSNPRQKKLGSGSRSDFYFRNNEVSFDVKVNIIDILPG